MGVERAAGGSEAAEVMQRHLMKNLGNKATFKLTHVDSGRQNQDSLGELSSAPPPTSILEYHEWEFIPRKSLTILSYPVFF